MVRSRFCFKRVESSFHRIQYFLITALVFSLSSCYNEPEFIGGNLIPAGDLTSVKIDTTFEVSAYTIQTDSITSSDFSYGILGCLNSPIFGKTKADFLTKIYLGTFKDEDLLFGTYPFIDSLVLYLKRSDYYGDKHRLLNVRVYELNTAIEDSTSYNGLKAVDSWYNPVELGSCVYSGDTLLKVRIDYSVAKRIINADQDDEILTSNDNFSEFFKGFYITCDDLTSEGVMYAFDFSDSRTSLKLYYHNLGVDTSKVFSFILGTTSATFKPPRFNHFSHDYSKADPNFKIKFLDNTETQDSVFYLESLGGVMGVINLDGIDEWLKKMPITINRAELRIEPEKYSGMPQDSIVSTLYYSTDQYAGVYTEDQEIASNQGKATYATYSTAKKYYSINLTTHIQTILAGKSSEKKIYLSTDLTSLDRTVLRSGLHSKRMKLVITYSKL